MGGETPLVVFSHEALELNFPNNFVVFCEDCSQILGVKELDITVDCLRWRAFQAVAFEGGGEIRLLPSPQKKFFKKNNLVGGCWVTCFQDEVLLHSFFSVIIHYHHLIYLLVLFSEIHATRFFFWIVREFLRFTLQEWFLPLLRSSVLYTEFFHSWGFMVYFNSDVLPFTAEWLLRYVR